MKKICVFMVRLHNSGALISTYNMARGLTDRGYDVTLIALDGRSDSQRMINPAFRVIDLKVYISTKSSYFSTVSTCLFAFMRIVKSIKNNMPDIVLCSDSPILTGIVCLALKYARLRNKIKCYHFNRNTFTSNLESLNRFFEPFVIFLFKKIYRSPDKVIAISKGVANDLLQYDLLSSKNLVTIYNPVVDSSIETQKKEEVSHPFFAIENVKIVTSVGFLVYRKGFHVLIEAFEMLAQSMPMLRLLIIGDERDDSQYLKKLKLMIKNFKIEDKISLIGYKENPFPYIAKSDVFVLASYDEGFGRVLPEAMSCGVTPVSTNCPHGPSEILDNGKYGYLVPVGDCENMADGIRLALEKPIPSQILKERASYFSMNNAINAYINLIENDS